jgi:hypothetical protein
MSFTERVGRSDWLWAIKVCLVVSLILMFLAVVVTVVLAALRGSVTLPIDAATAGADRLPEGTNLSGDATVDVRLTSASWGQSILHALTQLPALAVVLAAFALLLRVVNDARRGDPFTRRTVRRLRAVGLILLVGGTASDAVQFLAVFMLAMTVPNGSHPAVYVFTGSWIFMGVGTLAIAEVVGRGRAMRAELDGVI